MNDHQQGLEKISLAAGAINRVAGILVGRLVDADSEGGSPINHSEFGALLAGVEGLSEQIIDRADRLAREVQR